MENIINEVNDIVYNKRSNPNYTKFDRVYPYTTEMISQYMKDLDNKDILSVVGSGDHFLNACLLGAKSIDSFDINNLAIKYLNLKIAAVNSLNKNEFYEFLGNDSKKYFDRIKYSLYFKDINFWNWYINNIVNGKGIQSSNMFYPRNGIYTNKNLYMNDKGYNTLKSNIKRLDDYDTYCSDINDLYLDKKYDRIYLSNLCEYQVDLDKFINTVKRLYNDNLNDDGILYYAYINYIDRPLINNLLNNFKDTEVLNIDGAFRSTNKVLTLKRD